MDIFDLTTLDVVAQIGMVLFSVTAIVLVARQNRWGFVFGLFAQPFYLATHLIHSQWGGVACTMAFTASWLYGIYLQFFRKI